MAGWGEETADLGQRFTDIGGRIEERGQLFGITDVLFDASAQACLDGLANRCNVECGTLDYLAGSDITLGLCDLFVDLGFGLV